MSRVYIDRSISMQFNVSEIDTLSKARDILKETRHQLFLQDDDSDAYWELNGAVDFLDRILKNQRRAE